MKFIFGLTIVLIASHAMAQTSSVKVTSFNFTGARTTAAELCGKVTGAVGTEIVQVNVDPNSKVPGHYSTLVSDDGTFCVVVSTTTGEATAALKGEPHIETAVVGSEISRDLLARPHPPIRNWVCRAHAFDSAYPDYGGTQSASRYTAEQNAIYSCQIFQKKRCVAGSCYQR